MMQKGIIRASFHLTLDHKTVKLSIQDNGVGFETDSASFGGNGIKNMKRRAAEIGAQFDIVSAEGKGTSDGIEILPALSAGI